jgi:predicted nucleic acid-binding Zn ribbon protein
VQHPHNESRRRQSDPIAPRGGLAPIDEILKRWLKQNKATKRVNEGAIFSRWKDIVGDAIADRTRIVDVIHGELIVEVDSAALLNELSTYYRREILESIRQIDEFQGIHKLRFRAGSF